MWYFINNIFLRILEYFFLFCEWKIMRFDWLGKWKGFIVMLIELYVRVKRVVVFNWVLILFKILGENVEFVVWIIVK